MNEAELRTLLVSGDGRLLDDLGWGNAFRDTQRKLRANLPRRFEPGVDFVRRRLVIDSRWWWHEPGDPHLEALQAAVWEDRLVEGEYEGWDGSRKPVCLEAYGLAAKAGLWYFVGRRDGEWRTYRVSRFVSARKTTPFGRDPAFDLSEWWVLHSREYAAEFSAFRFSLALPEAQVRFLRSIAPGRVEVKRAFADRPGWVEVEVGLDSSLYAELVVLGLGRECVVLEPSSLRDAVVHRAQDSIAAHSGRSTPT